MAKTRIEWTGKNGYTWNPVVGCSHASPGCAHCYAETMAIRLAAMGQEKYKQVIRPRSISQGAWPGPDDKYEWSRKCFLSESELEKPFHWKKSRVIFVSSMGDLFHENVPFEWIDKVMAVIALNQRHTFMILTKRTQRMAEYFKDFNYDVLEEVDMFREAIRRIEGDDPDDMPESYYKESMRIEEAVRLAETSLDNNRCLPNLHIGVTAENQETADLRIPILLQIPAALRFASIEPMLGPVDLREYLTCDRCGNYGVIPEWVCAPDPELTADDCPKCGGASSTHENHLDWVILGMETSTGARTFPGAAEAIVNVKDQCVSAGVPFFYKGPKHIAITSWAGNPQYHFGVYGDGKEKEYTINGVEYRQFPEGI